MQIEANGLSVEVQDSAPGDTARPAVLLVMGLGGQLIHWPPPFVGGLEQAGFRVIRFDNRDAGLSSLCSHCGNVGTARVVWASLQAALGGTPRAPYQLTDMACDALGVLDALGIDRAHVVGVSMGGMIAQRMALAAPQRVISLCSIMSSSGARGLPGPQPQVIRAMLRKPRGHADPQAVVRYYMDFLTTIGSPGFALPPADLRAMIDASIARSYRPQGNLRQLLAVLADTGRAALLSRIQCPTLVLHGRDDPFVPLACGQDTARRIPGAHLAVIDGMGHDLAPQACTRLLAHLIPFLQAHTPVAPAIP